MYDWPRGVVRASKRGVRASVPYYYLSLQNQVCFKIEADRYLYNVEFAVAETKEWEGKKKKERERSEINFVSKKSYIC